VSHDPELDRLYPDDERPIPADPVCLHNGYVLAWCVEGDGSRWPWLVSTTGDTDPDPAGGCRCGQCVPAHERLGQLPWDVRERLQGYHRCGRPTASGRPCRQYVSEAGAACHVHQDPTT
jgi:hypothetical protein